MNSQHKSLEKWLFFSGLAIVALSAIPYLLLGTDSIVPYHDQLDGEIIAYLYQAKYLFDGSNIIPEFLNGAAKTALVPPAPLAVFLFCFLPAFPAYMALQFSGQLLAYTGMYLLSGEAVKRPWIKAAAALLYAFLPFLPVYGWSQYGIPLLLWCGYQLYQKRYRLFGFIYIAVFAGMSSLVLCGYVFLGIWALCLAVLLFQKKLKDHIPFLCGFGILLLIYMAENLTLILQVLGIGVSFVSHKTEYHLTANPFGQGLLNYFLYNGQHSADNHWPAIMLFTAAALLCIWELKKGKEHKKRLILMSAVLAVIVIFCVLSALWNSGAGIFAREHMQALGSFQLDRVLWMAPALWYFLMALSMETIWEYRSTLAWLKYPLLAVFLGMMGFLCLKSSLVKPCIQKVLRPGYDTISWSDYLALGVMEQVESFILEEEGLEKTEYKVASLGIDPAAALYHGFYCVDGYSNNYDLEYKHRFRKVLAPELERNDYLREYYDGWGNRCYLFFAEIPGYFNIQKGSFWFQDLQIDTQALAKLGCRYILSAAYIMNSEEENLVLLREEPFETADSYYRIYIYRIQEDGCDVRE